MKAINVGSYLALFVGIINLGAWIGAAFGDDTARSMGYGGMALGAFGLALGLQATVKYGALRDRIRDLEQQREAS